MTRCSNDEVKAKWIVELRCLAEMDELGRMSARSHSAGTLVLGISICQPAL
jgi:hypothetical protein